MSAIVGVCCLDGRPVDRADLERMIGVLAHRGPDGVGLWNEGAAGLGHRMLRTTPESLYERLPRVDRAGSLIVTADARIDNRAELIATLGLTDCPSEEVADSQLILAAYQRWGECCPEKLLGDFAFAIWDGSKGSLFCARDHFGVKPFYYYLSGRLFAFASEIKALLCLPEVPRRLNEVKVAYHLQPELLLQDDSLTFYQDIFRLAPRRSMTVSAQGVRRRVYWSLDPTRELKLGSDGAYAEAFCQVFTEAVRCRLRSLPGLGSTLSGGLDSSSVTCVARKLLAQNGDRRLPTFSAVFDEVRECDERPFINAVLAQYDLEPHYAHPDQVSPLGDLDRALWHMDEACLTPNLMLMPWTLYGAAREQGIRVLLEGVDGDTTVSHGLEYLDELACAGRWEIFAREVRALGRRINVSPWLYLQHYGLTHLVGLARRGRWLAFAREANEISKHFEVSRCNLGLNYGLKRLAPESLRRFWWTLRGRNRPATESGPIINRRFARRIALDERIRSLDPRWSTLPKSAREAHYRALSSGVPPFAFEVADKATAAFSLEARYPFYDRRLVEFCLALPPQQKLHDGWTRVILRRAMTDVLPLKVQWRASKSDLSLNFIRGLLTFERELLDEVVLNDSGDIGEYVDLTRLRKAYHRYVSQGTHTDALSVWQALTLAMWLRHAGLRP